MGGIERTCAIGSGHPGVSTSSRDTIADGGCYAEVRGRVARGGFAPAAVERGAESAHRGGELPVGGFGLGGGAAARHSHQCVVQVAASAWQAGAQRRRVCPGGPCVHAPLQNRRVSVRATGKRRTLQHLTFPGTLLTRDCTNRRRPIGDTLGTDLERSMPKLLTVAEAAAELGVPPGSLRTAARKHGLLVRIGRAIRIDPTTLPELIELCRDQPKDLACSAAPTESGTSVTPAGNSSRQALEVAARLKARSRSTSRKSTDRPAPLRRI